MIFIAFILSCAACQYVTTIAGNGTASSINGQGVAATFYNPWGVAVDTFGNLFVSDASNNKIRMINATGFVSTLAGSGKATHVDGQGTNASFNSPIGIFVDSVGNLYVTDYQNHLIRLINSTGYVTTIAGSGNLGSTDGQSTSASFDHPFGICVDSSSNIYIADQSNHIIRMVNSSGYVSTIAGNGVPWLSNGQALNATFDSPVGISRDENGSIYVSEMNNNVIRIINSTGFVSIYAGTGLPTFADGPASAASFRQPCGLSFDSLGNLIVSELGNNRIRMINTTGYVSTIAGNGIKSFRDGFALNAEFNWPMALAVDSFGIIYVADANNNRIRKLDMNYTATTTTTVNTTTYITTSTTTSISRSTTSTTTVTITSTAMSPLAQQTSSASAISPSAFASPLISTFSILSFLETAVSTSIHKQSSSSTHSHQNLIFSSIYFKPEFTASFFIGFFFAFATVYLTVIIKQRRSLPIRPRLRFIRHEKEMEQKMAELRKKTMSKEKKKASK